MAYSLWQEKETGREERVTILPAVCALAIRYKA